MKKIALFLFAVLLTCSVSELYAQKPKKKSNSGHELRFTVKDAKDSLVYLAVHYRDKLLLKDSTRALGGGKFQFIGDEPYQDGLYILVSQQKTPYVNFILDKNQHFSISCDTNGDVRNTIIVNSPENVEMLKFQQKSVQSRHIMNDLTAKMKAAEAQNQKDSVDFYTKKMQDLNKEVEQFIADLIAANPTALFSKMQKVYQDIEIPEPPTRADGTIDSSFRLIYYREHYWDNTDLGDSRLLYTPAMEPKINDYFTKLLFYQDADTINKYIDMTLAKTEKDTLFYRFMVEWLAYKFETSKVIGHDAVFVHIVKNNHLKGKCTWIDEDLLKKYEKRVKNLSPIMIGNIAPEIMMPDTTQTDDIRRWHSSYRMEKPYVILWFYSPTCPTCKKEAEKLHHLYDSLTVAGSRNFDVYAVSADDDIKAWKKYVREHNYPWIQVGGMKSTLDYMTNYNIYETGTPSMLIFNNKTKKIILNKRIPIENIPIFLKQYEAIQARAGR